MRVSDRVFMIAVKKEQLLIHSKLISEKLKKIMRSKKLRIEYFIKRVNE